MEVKIASEGLDNFGLGTLKAAASGEEISYQPYEFSRYRLGIIAKKGMAAGDHLALSNAQGDFSFAVEEINNRDVCFGLVRYKLKCLDPNENIEGLLKKTGSDRYLNNGTSASRIQNARFEIKPSITVSAKTFGTRVSHDCVTVNVSRSGVLLAAGGPVRIPFIKNTLLELTMERDGNWLSEPVHCIAKVVRTREAIGNNKEVVRQFGVKIIEMNPRDEKVWESALLSIEDDITHNEAA